MPKFSIASEIELATCHPDLVKVLREAIKYVDFKVLEGFRGKTAQEAAFAKGLTQLHYPYGNHNKNPSLAADIAPYPVDWEERSTALARFAFVGGVIRVCSIQLGIPVRFGWDWNRNLDPRDESFLDWPHVELDLASTKSNPQATPVTASAPAP